MGSKSVLLVLVSMSGGCLTTSGTGLSEEDVTRIVDERLASMEFVERDEFDALKDRLDDLSICLTVEPGRLQVTGCDVVITDAKASVAPPTEGTGNLVVAGGNVHVVNGAGATATNNGRGNVIVGYSAEPTSADGNWVDSTPVADRRSGSHNLILGDANGWTSYGALIAGYGTLSGEPYCGALGGTGNSCVGTFGAVVAGTANQVRNQSAATLGGRELDAAGLSAVTAGGWGNVSSGDYGIAGGGDGNTAGATLSVVFGGSHLLSYGAGTSVFGGFNGTRDSNDNDNT
jgi:hypothetical protein